MNHEKSTIIECTAWDLVGEYYHLIDHTHHVRIKGGNTLYEDVVNTRSDTIRLARIATDPLRQINRYIHPDTIVQLIPIERNS